MKYILHVDKSKIADEYGKRTISYLGTKIPMKTGEHQLDMDIDEERLTDNQKVKYAELRKEMDEENPDGIPFPIGLDFKSLRVGMKLEVIEK